MVLTVNQHYLTDFLMLDLDAETATLVRDFHGAGLSYKKIAQGLYKECRIQVTVGAFNRIAGRLKRGREKILAAEPSEADLENYPKIAREAILHILTHYAPVNDIDHKKGQSEVPITEGMAPKDDRGPLLHAEEIQEGRPVTISVAPSSHPKSCPRCTGNMLFEEDWHGAYSTCFSCGYVYEPEISRNLESLKEEEIRDLSRRRNPSHDGQPL